MTDEELFESAEIRKLDMPCEHCNGQYEIDETGRLIPNLMGTTVGVGHCLVIDGKNIIICIKRNGSCSESYFKGKKPCQYCSGVIETLYTSENKIIKMLEAQGVKICYTDAWGSCLHSGYAD